MDELTPEERKEIFHMVVEEVVIDRNNNVDITLAIPIDDDFPEPNSPETDYVAIVSKEPLCVRLNSNGKLRYAWAVDLGPFKPGR